MAATDYTASQWILLDEVLQEQYFNQFFEQSFRHGRTTNMLIPFAEEGEFKVDSDGINVQVEAGYADTARLSSNPLSDFGTPRAFSPDKYKVRFTPATTSTNDFTTINVNAEVSHLDLENGGSGAIVDVAERVYRQIFEDFTEKLAIARNTGRDGKLALVNGTPKQNNLHYFADAASTPTNTTGARFPVDNGSIGYFPAGVHIDIYNGSTLVAGNVEVTDNNPTDLSIGVQFNSTGVDVSTGNLASVADNHSIYRSGSYGVGMYSLGAWFSRPTTSDSFIAGRNRTTAAYRHMIIPAVREGSANAQVQLDHLNQAARANNYVQDKERNVAVVGAPEIIDSLRSRLDANAVIQQPAAGGNSRFAELGAMGVAFQHPQFGRTVLMADPLMIPNKLRVITPETWRSLYAIFRGLMMMQSGEGYGMWYRKQSTTPNAGKGKIFRCDGYANLCDICTQPRLNVGIEAVTA